MPEPAGASSRLHLALSAADVAGGRPARGGHRVPGLPSLAAGIERPGGGRLRVDWGDLPWTSLTDPSGNERCLLPAPS